MAPHGYYEVAHTPGLWRHVTRPVQFTLVVDDFGVKYVGEENAKHLIKAIKDEGYKLEVDWSGTRYCGITLDWDYDERTLVISMPGYVQKNWSDSNMKYQKLTKIHHISQNQENLEKIPMTQYQQIRPKS